MKFYLIKSKKRNWTNKAGRELLGIGIGECIKIVKGNAEVARNVTKAPASAARVMRATNAMTGLCGIAVTRDTLEQLDAHPGDYVEVTSMYATVAATAPSKSTSTNGTSLRQRLKSMNTGDVLEVSESAAKSGAYSLAKELGIKVKKTGPTQVTRVS